MLLEKWASTIDRDDFLQGYDIVMKIAEQPTDSRDRPLRPIIISGAGELVLRGKIVPRREPGSPVGPRQLTKRIRSRSASISSLSSQSRPSPRSRSRSPPSGDRDRHRQFERRSRSRSGSGERGNRSSGHEKHHRSSKKSKRLRRGDDSRDKDREALARSSKAPREETEAELDARYMTLGTHAHVAVDPFHQTGKGRRGADR